MDELGGTAPVRHVEDADIATDEARQLPRAGIVGAQRPPDAEQVRPQPERVAALDRPGRLDPPHRRDPRGRRPGLEDRGLAGPIRLAGSQGDGPAIGHEQRIERVDEVGAVGLRLQDVDGGPEAREHRGERVVLALRELEIDGVAEAVGRIVECRTERRPGPLDEGLEERSGHALGAESTGGRGHRRRIPAATPSSGPCRRSDEGIDQPCATL